jgi:hypothetical protein
MVRLHFETLAPGMKARLNPRQFKHGGRPIRVLKPRHGSINCLLADAIKMPHERARA